MAWVGGPWREALLVAALVLIWSLGVRGFDGTRWSDVPIVKSFAEPLLYRQDPFIMALHDGTPAAYPYRLIAAVVASLAWLSFDQVLFGIYVPATIAALALLYRIALQLTDQRWAAVLALVLYVAGFRLVTVGSAILHSAETTPQILALPLQLGALYALLVGRLAAAGALMGLAFNLHVPSTVYLAGALGIYEVLGLRRLGLRAVLASLGLMALAGAPTIAGSLLHHTDRLPLWALYLARAELATDISLTIHFASRALIVYNALGLALLALALRAAPADAGRRLTLVWCAAVGLMCLGALLFFDLWLGSPFSSLVARLQLPRSAWILNVLGLVYLARYLVVGWRNGSLPPSLALLLVAAMVAAPSDFVPLDPLLVAASLLVLAQQLARPTIARRAISWMPWVLVVVCALAGVAGFKLRELDFSLSVRTAIVFGGLALGWGVWHLAERRSPGTAWAAAPALVLSLLAPVGLAQAEDLRYASAHRGGLRAAAEFQEWARTQTPVDSVFLLLPSEPNNYSFYKNAERAVFLVRERANQAPYFRVHNVEFEQRVRALGIERPLNYRQDLDPAYRRLTEARVRELAREFGVTHFVPARDGDFSFPVAYRSGGWTVYEVAEPVAR